MGGLSNFREIGKFDVLVAPRNPIGAFDAEQFKKDALELFEKGSQNIIVDLDNLDFLYSDAFNALSLIYQKLSSRNGSLGILATDELAVKSLQQAGVDRYVMVFRTEPEIMAASLTPAPAPAPATLATETVASGSKEQGNSHTRKFTQSFNSSFGEGQTGVEKTALKEKSYDIENSLNRSSTGTPGLLIGILVGLLLVVAVLSFIFLR